MKNLNLALPSTRFVKRNSKMSMIERPQRRMSPKGVVKVSVLMTGRFVLLSGLLLACLPAS
jgi:hypothetical protein